MSFRKGRRYARQFLEQLATFIHDHFGVRLEDAREVPHVSAFLEHVVERPRTYSAGKLVERPVRETLVDRCIDLQKLLAYMGSSLQISEGTIRYAAQLRLRYRRESSGATPAREGDVIKLIESLDEHRLRDLRLKAIVLLVWHSWARPSEIIGRQYPDEIDASHPDGVIVTVPRSKANPGSRRERFLIRHDANTFVCAVCCLGKWLNVLGDNYRGPLFVGTHRNDTLSTTQYTPGMLTRALMKAFRNAGVTGRHYTAYSLRRGQATRAAALRIAPAEIQRALRHKSFSQSLAYIDADTLFTTLGLTLD